ncbi:MAG: DMT family transporter [Erysipelotrichaceae bacterium]|nr:DMT family transporter [Erysipelotrichaceae bacterium]
MQKKAVIHVILSMILWGTIGIFRRYIDLSSSLLAFARGIVGALFLYVFLKIRKYNLPKIQSKKQIWLLILSGALMGLNWLCLFEAYNYTSVATATLCYYMQPIMIVLVSPVLFKEKLTSKKLLCVAVALLGMVFVSGVLETQVGGFLGIVLGLLAAVLYGIVVIMNKFITNVDSYQKTMIQLFSAAFIMIPYMIITSDTIVISMDVVSILMLLIVCIVHTGIAYALYFGAIPHIKTQTVALLSYLDPVVAILLSAIVLQEPLTILGIIGAICILGSTIVSEWE